MRCRGLQGLANLPYLSWFRLLCFAQCCNVLRSRWCQSGVNRGVWLHHDCARAWDLPEGYSAPRPARLDPAYPGPLLPLDAHYEP